MKILNCLAPHCIFIIAVVLLTSCKKEKPFNVFVGKPVIVETKELKVPFKKELMYKLSSLNLYEKMENINPAQFKKFGSFYTRDFTIFQVNNLDLLEDNLYFNEVYLYFIDSTLHKIQAHTTKNMSDFFLSKYGGAKLVLRDRFNKDLVSTEGAIYRSGSNYHMNKNLNNYKLKWALQDRSISYQVDESAQKNFEVIEELVDLDNQQDIKIKPDYIFTIQSEQYKQLLARIKMEEIMASKKANEQEWLN